jgi:hypothetical protein
MQLALLLAVGGVRAQTYAQSKHAVPRYKRLTGSDRREHMVPGLAFRLTSPDLLDNADLDCSDDNGLARFTAGVEIRANYTEACYNIADIFAWRDDVNQTAGRIDRSCHWDSDSCPNEWRYLDHSNFDPNATHSVITTRLAGDSMSEWLDWPAQVFRTFERENCDEEGGWHQWMGCEEVTDDCRELPYGVRSFQVSYQAEEDDRVGEGVLAGEHGAVESRAKVVGMDVMRMLVVDVLVCGFGFGIQCSSSGARKLGRARNQRRNSSRLLCHPNYIPTWKVTLLA